MQLSRFYEKSDFEKIPVVKLLVLLVSVLSVNYFAIYLSQSPGSNYILISALTLLLIKVNPVYGFVFCFVVHVDLMGCFYFTGIKFLTLLGMYVAFFADSKSWFELFEDKKFKRVFYLGLLFTFYLIFINIGLKSGLTSQNIIFISGFIFGFLTILPAYHFTLRQPQNLFLSLLTVAAAFIFVYYFSMARGLNLIKLEGGDRGTGANIERLAGYDVRQFCIFFTYLIPAVVLSSGLKNIYKYFLISIGIFSYVILILAFYRLAMFYVAMGTIVSFVLIRKYAESINFLKIFFYLIVFFFIANLFFGEYLTEINKLFSATFNYFSGKGEDTSADARFESQLPILTSLFYNNWWTGIGLNDMLSIVKTGMMGYVDMPFLGTLATFGFIGMFLYYLKFIFLLSSKKRDLNHIGNILDNQSPFMFYLYLTLKAYLVTMVTFRMFYISWELTFDYQQAEFGLFAGAFLALERVFTNYEGE